MFVLMSCEAYTLGHAPSPISLEAALGEKFYHWYGASGDSYLHSVFTAFTSPYLEGASFIAIARDDFGNRHVLGFGLAEGGQSSAGFRAMLLTRFPDADEIHLHLLAKTPCAALEVVEDLKLRHGVVKRQVN